MDDVFSYDSISNVKQLITIQFWLYARAPASPFSLHYKSMKLCDKCTLEDYNIQDGTSIVIKAEAEYTLVD